MIVSLLPVSALAAGNNQTGAVPGAAEQVPKVSATDETGHVNISKAVSEDGKTLTLEAYVTDEAETVVTSAPMDIVLVLDTSGSMKNPISGFKGPSKMSALQTAVKSFIQQVAEAMPETATEENVQRTGPTTPLWKPPTVTITPRATEQRIGAERRSSVSTEPMSTRSARPNRASGPQFVEEICAE